MPAGRNIYPSLIILLLGAFVAFSTWAALRAGSAGPQVTDTDYYSKGLRYTSTLLEKQAAESQGWTVTTSLAGGALEFRLSDRQGRAIVSAEGSLTLFLPEESASVTFPLQEIVPGTYRLPLRAGMKGEMSARLEFAREGARLSRQLLLNL